MENRKHRVSAELLQRARKMRGEPAPAEQKLWRCLRDRQLGGFKFRRQHSFKNYILDFFCADCRLVVELDGDSHSDQRAYDEERTKQLSKHGLQVLRFDNPDVFEHLEVVLERILESCLARIKKVPLTPTLSPEYRGEGVKLPEIAICAGI